MQCYEIFLKKIHLRLGAIYHIFLIALALTIIVFMKLGPYKNLIQNVALNLTIFFESYKQLSKSSQKGPFQELDDFSRTGCINFD